MLLAEQTLLEGLSEWPMRICENHRGRIYNMNKTNIYIS